MNKTRMRSGCYVILLTAAVLGVGSSAANATVLGVTSATNTFNLYAKADTISTGDGDSMWMWGYASSSTARMQYPGPTIVVDQGAVVTITLHNQLPLPVSIVFPGQLVTATGGSPGLLTREVPAAAPGATTGTVTYTFTASQPGTYTYYSGTRPELETEMGLAGTIVVRPTGFASMNPKQAYGDASTAYDQEYLFFVSEADPLIHQQVAFASGTLAQIQAKLARVDNTKRHAVDWFLNGRNYPDTMADATPATDGWLPTQPYNGMPMAHPGEKVLIRWVSGGRDFHPYHTHGQNHLVIARDGRLLTTTPAAANPVADMPVSDYTTTTVPGETVDAIWGPWTGARLGWDIYGTADINPHTCNGLTTPSNSIDPITHEYCLDHYKPIPVQLPAESNRNFGPMWGGTPYLGVAADVPPLNPGAHNQQNPMAGLSFMWHSHNEKELTTNNIFIGGMATMMLVVPAGTPIP